MKMPAPETRMVAIVRDPQGRVKFDDWDNIPEVYHPYLTPEDWQHIEERANGYHTQHGGA